MQSVWRRVAGLLAVITFAATSPGLSGLELAAHIGGWVDLTHERQVHVEPAGQSAHNDSCQLGMAACHGKLPAVAAALQRAIPVSTGIPGHAVSAPPAARRYPRILPRAPPV